MCRLRSDAPGFSAFYRLPHYFLETPIGGPAPNLRLRFICISPLITGARIATVGRLSLHRISFYMPAVSINRNSGPNLMMLSDLGLWLIGTGGVIVAAGFVGLAFSRNREQLPDPEENELHYPAVADLPITPFGRRTPEDRPNARRKASNSNEPSTERRLRGVT
jgi:hypothetical protein